VPARSLAPADAVFHPLYARLLFHALQDRGLDGRAALAAAGLSDERIGAEARHLTFAEMHALMRAARSICPDPLLALEWGALARDSVHGIASAAILSSRDVREALTTLCTVAALRATIVRFRMVEDGEEARLEIEESTPLHELHDFLFMALAVLLAQLLAAVLGPAGSRMRIDLPVGRQPWVDGGERAFPCPVRFAAARLCLHLPQDLLARPCPAADARTHEAAMRQCALDAMALHGALSARVAAYLGQQAGRYPTLAAVARTFATSPRTLCRRLQREGRTFQALLEDTRRDAAERYLTETTLAVDVVADHLGYAHPTNFIRAFRRWHGCTPQQYRLRQEGTER
jgi:AraC-like DNA-binding protein